MPNAVANPLPNQCTRAANGFDAKKLDSGAIGALGCKWGNGAALLRDMMKLTLINPKTPESFWSFKWAVNQVLPGKRALNPPLGLATLAALTPSHWSIEIVDENIESVPLAPNADIVGIGGMAVQGPRQRELIAYYRERGYHVVVGGAAASLTPERYEGLADTVVSGEAEYIWPEFCRDFEAGCASMLGPDRAQRLILSAVDPFRVALSQIGLDVSA